MKKGGQQNAAQTAHAGKDPGTRNTPAVRASYAAPYLRAGNRTGWRHGDRCGIDIVKGSAEIIEEHG